MSPLFCVILFYRFFLISAATSVGTEFLGYARQVLQQMELLKDRYIADMLYLDELRKYAHSYFVYGVNALLPNVMGVMKYIGAVYILWLAIHIAVSKPSSESAEQSASFLKGFMLQFANVKIYTCGRKMER